MKDNKSNVKKSVHELKFHVTPFVVIQTECKAVSTRENLGYFTVRVRHNLMQ